MLIRRLKTIEGPNIYAHRPVIYLELDLQDLAEIPTQFMVGFTERVLALFPGLRDHGCNTQVPGGFVHKLLRGTYMGHVVEHVALELSGLAGVPSYFGKTVSLGKPGIYRVIVEFQSRQAMEFLLFNAVRVVERLVRGQYVDLNPILEEARSLVAHSQVGPSTQCILDAARRRDIPVRALDYGSLVQLGYGKKAKRIQAAVTENTAGIAMELAQDKDVTKRILKSAFVPVPEGRVAASYESALKIFNDFKSAVVVKPVDGHHGKGVTVGVATEREFFDAYQRAVEQSPRVLIEEVCRGNDYRLLTVGGRLVAAAQRIAPFVTGDGRRTVADLLAELNRDPLRGVGHEAALSRVEIDSALLSFLRRQGLSLDSVIKKDRRIFLRDTANLSTGGTSRDVTNIVHSSIRELAERASSVIGLDVCGVDLIGPDISAPYQEGKVWIVEVNAGPGLRMHAAPSEGNPHDVGGVIVEHLFGSSDGRIPVVSVTGTNGKTTVTRMIAHVLSHTGRVTGMTTTDGVFIGERCIEKGDMTGPASARMILGDTRVEAAVLETARGGILNCGLGYEWSDVGIITNIRSDHIGQDGITDIGDVFHIKSLVAERVRPGGTLILNADQPELAGIAQKRRVRDKNHKLVFYSVSQKNEVVRDHLAAGGTAYFHHDCLLVEATGNSARVFGRADSVPATFGGAAGFQISNVLAAVAACRALGLSIEATMKALEVFGVTTHGKGRANLYKLASGYIFLDYGHNADAITAVGALCAQWQGYRTRAVIGMPGDRTDRLVETLAKASLDAFDELIFKEDLDTRGRPRGEVADILFRTVLRHAPQKPCLAILDERSAVETALENLAADQVAVVFYDQYSIMEEILEKYHAVPASSVEPREEVESPKAPPRERPRDSDWPSRPELARL